MGVDEEEPLSLKKQPQKPFIGQRVVACRGNITLKPPASGGFVGQCAQSVVHEFGREIGNI